MEWITGATGAYSKNDDKEEENQRDEATAARVSHVRPAEA